MSGRGAGDRVPYCLRVTPRVQVAHFPADLRINYKRKIMWRNRRPDPEEPGPPSTLHFLCAGAGPLKRKPKR